MNYKEIKHFIELQLLKYNPLLDSIFQALASRYYEHPCYDNDFKDFISDFKKLSLEALTNKFILRFDVEKNKDNMFKIKSIIKVVFYRMDFEPVTKMYYEEFLPEFNKEEERRQELKAEDKVNSIASTLK